jgi:hypothetical protein
LEGLSEEEISSLEFRKLKFCPTYLITGQIFRQIFSSTDYQLLKGPSGVGKTYSLILYTLLSEIIFRYRHNYCKRMTDLPIEINSELPKAFYWFADMNSEIYSESALNSLIKRRFYEL